MQVPLRRMPPYSNKTSYPDFELKITFLKLLISYVIQNTTKL